MRHFIRVLGVFLRTLALFTLQKSVTCARVSVTSRHNALINWRVKAAVGSRRYLYFVGGGIECNSFERLLKPTQ